MSKTCTILVVEDEPLIRMDLVDRLHQFGCKTLEAGSAAEAISILEQRQDVTVVFTDIQMPGTMDGIQLAEVVRQRWPPTLIIISSGKIQPKLHEDISFLSKPYDDAKLGRVIQNVVARLAS